MASLADILAQINGSGPDLTTPADVLGGQAGSVGGPDLPRGIRNNNPGNIRRSAIPWEGKVEGQDTEFETFASPEHGIRALEKNLTAYQTKHGLDTPRKIINRWAPPTENDTGSYVNAVANALGVGPDDPIDVQDPATMQRLRDAIIQHENGQNPYAGGASAAPAAPRRPGVDVEGARQRAIGTREQMEAAAAAPPQDDYNALLQGAASLLKGPKPGGSVSAGDYGKSAVASVGSLGSMLAGAGEYVTQQLGEGEGQGNEAWRSLTPMFASMRGTTDAFTREWLSRRSKEAQERAARQFTTLDPDQTIWQGGVGEFVSSLALKGAESLAPTLVPLGSAALLGRLSVVAASTVLGGSEAVLSMGSAAADMADAVREAPIAELMQSPQFQTRLKEAQGNEVAAREAFINDVQGWSPIITGAIVGLTAKIVGKSFDDIFSPDKGLGLFKRTGVGFTSEATQEAGQSAAEQIAQNVARRVFNSDTGVWDGVLEASLQGAAVGGPMGGGMAAAFGTRPKPVAIDTKPVADDVAAAVNPVPVGPPTAPDTTAIPVPNVDPTGAMNAPDEGGMFAGIGPQTWADIGGGTPPPPPSGGGPGRPAMSFSSPELADAIQNPMAVGAEPVGMNFPGPAEPDTGGLELAPEPGPPMPENAGPQLPEGVIPFDTREPPPEASQPLPYQPAPEDQVLVEGGPDRTARQQVGWRVRRTDRNGNLIASKLMGKEEAANALAAVWENESLRKGTGDTIEVLPARQTVFGDRSPDAEPFADINAQLNDLQSEDRRGVYISKKGLAHLQSIGKLDEVLGRGVPIRNFDNLGGIMLAKDEAAARELIDLKQNDAGSLDEIIGYATTAGRGKPVGKDSLVAQLTDENMNIVRERLISPAERRQVIEEWGEDVRFVSPEKALTSRAERVKAERNGREEADIVEEELGKQIYKRAAEATAEERSRRKFTEVPEPDEVLFRGKELSKSRYQAQKGREKKAELETQKGEVLGTPLPPLRDTNREILAKERQTELDRLERVEGEGEKKKRVGVIPELEARVSELAGDTTRSGILKYRAAKSQLAEARARRETVARQQMPEKDREELVTRISDAISEVNAQVQKAEGEVSGTTEGYVNKQGEYVPSVVEKRAAQYREMYGNLVDTAVRLELQQKFGSKQDVIEAQAAYDQALEDVKLFLQTEGGFTRGEARMEAAERVVPKARRKIFAETKAAQARDQLTPVERAAAQGFIERPEEVTTDEMTDKEAKSAGKLRNTGEQIVSQSQTMAGVAREAEVSIKTAAKFGKIKLRTKRMQDAAKKLEGMLADPETRFLVRRWLTEYTLALRQNTPAKQQNKKTNRNWVWHGRAARTSEMLGRLFFGDVTPTTTAMALEHVSTRVVKLATRANRLGIGAEMDPDGFLTALETGETAVLQAFLSEQVTPVEQTKDFPSNLTAEMLKSMTSGHLNTLYVRALNFLDAERTPDLVRSFMVRGIKKWLGRHYKTGAPFSQKEYDVASEDAGAGQPRARGTYKEYDRKGNVIYEGTLESRFVKARDLYAELLSGGKTAKPMAIEQVRELYKLAVEASKGAPAKERLPARPMGQYVNKLLRRVAESDKIKDILRASAKAEKQRVGAEGTQLTRTTTDKTAPDEYTRAESKYSPSVLLNNDPPRELRGKAQTAHEAKQTTAITEMAREYATFNEFLTKLENSKEFAAKTEERDDKDRLTEDARRARDAQTYAAWLHMYLGSFMKLNESQKLQNSKLLDEVLTLVEDLRNIRNLPMDNFIAQMGGAFSVEMAAQGRRAKSAINNALDKRNPQSKAEWMDASLSRVAAAEAAHTRLNELWNDNEDYVEIVQPIMEKIRRALVRDKWYSYTPSPEEREAVEFLFARWSHKEEWLERLTEAQRKIVLSEPVDPKLKEELYGPLSKRLDAAGFFDRDKALEKRFIKRYGEDVEARGYAVPRYPITDATNEYQSVGPTWERVGADLEATELEEKVRERRERDARLERLTDEEAATLSKNEQARRKALMEGTYLAGSGAVYAAKLANVRDLMQAFRDLIGKKIDFDTGWTANLRGRPKAVAEELRKAQQALRKATANDILVAESRMIEALRDLGAWTDISKKDGTGTIKLPDFETVSRQVAKLQGDLRALEAQFGYHRVALKDKKGNYTRETELLFIGGERTDAKGRLVGQDPKYLTQRQKITDRLDRLTDLLAALPTDPKSKTEAITYRKVGERLVRGEITKADAAAAASVLKLRQFMTELEHQLTLDLPKTPQPRGAKYKGRKWETNAEGNERPIGETPARKPTEKEELQRVRNEARQMLENQQAPLPFEVAPAVGLSSRVAYSMNRTLSENDRALATAGMALRKALNGREEIPAREVLQTMLDNGVLNNNTALNRLVMEVLQHLTPDTKVVVSTKRHAELLREYADPQAVSFLLMGAIDGTYFPEVDTVALPDGMLTERIPPGAFAATVLHELVHAGTMQAIEKDGELAAYIRMIMSDLQTQMTAAEANTWAYALSAEREFVAIAFSDVEFQKLLEKYDDLSGIAGLGKPSNLFQRFMDVVCKVYNAIRGTPKASLLEALVRHSDRMFTGPKGNSKLDVSKLQELVDSGPTSEIGKAIATTLNFDEQMALAETIRKHRSGDVAFSFNADVWASKYTDPLRNALADRAKLRKDLIYEGTTALNTVGELGRKFMVKALTVRQLHDFFVTEFGGKDGAFSKWFLAWEARNADASKALAEADKLSRRWTLLRDADVTDEVRLSEIMHDATTYGIHPDEDFPSAAALAAKAELAALKAGKSRTAYEAAREKYEATYGKLPNAHLEESQRELYNQLRAEWNKLSPAAQQLYREVRKYYRDTIERESKLFLLNAIRSSKLWEGEFTLTEDDIDFRKISREEGGVTGWLERTLGIDVKADRAAVEALKEKLKTDAGNLTKEELKLRKRALKMSEIELKEEIDQLRIITKMAKVPQLKKGPYFPLRRSGDYVVRATKLYDRKVFADRAEAKAWQNEIQLKDPTIQFRFPERGDGMIEIVALEVEYRTGETLSEVAKAREELIAQYGKDAVSDLDTKSNQFNNEASIPSNAALQTLLGKLQGNPGAQAAVRNFYLQTLSDRSFRKNEIKRKTIRGANAHQQQRAFAFYAKAASYYTAQLRYGHIMASAKLEMGKFVDQHRAKPGDRHSTLMLRKVADELALRDRQAAEIHDLPHFVRRGAEFSQFMLLTSPSYWMINASQPWMVTVPWLSGYTSTLDAVNELKKAQKLILHPLLQEAVSSYGGFKALWSKTTAESAFTVVEQVEDQIRHSTHERKDDLIRMIDDLKQASIIDLSFVAELRQIATGEESKMADAILDASRIMAHLTEVNNRIMTAIAAYEIYRKQGFDHKTATEFAKHAVAKTQMDYSAANKSRLFSANDAAWKPLVFQFMQYMQHMYVLMFEQVALAVRNENTGDRKRALRILGGMLGSHFIAGGIVGMTIQPVKWAFGLLAVAFGDDDEDNTFRNAVSGETYDRWVAEGLAAIFGANKFSEVLRAGLPRLAGLDLSTRMALGQIYMADLNPKNAETLAGSIAMSFLGPMPGLIGNMYQAAQKFAEGDLDRAVELSSPKMIRDAVRAYRFADEGVTDNTGKVIMRPSQLSPLDLFWQSMGFTSAKIAELYARNSAVKDRQMFANTRKAEVMKMQRMVRVTGEYREAQLALREYNRMFPENPITLSEVIKSLQGQREDERVAQQFGATLGARERAYAREGNPYNVE